MSARIDTIEEAVTALLEKHYAVIKLPEKLLEMTNNIFREGLTFFDLDIERKKLASSPCVLEGYRELGSERDAETGRPDLSESFTTWFRNTSNPEVQVWAENCKFHQTMSMGLKPYAGFTDSLLKALRSRIDPSYQMTDDPVVDICSESYLQMNFSRPAKESRDTITDTHEDGHILTILKPTKPGLMICPGKLIELPKEGKALGIFKPENVLKSVNLREDEAILVPSVPTFYITGGLVKPLFHKVINQGDKTRQSLMFFVNPTRRYPVEPWLENEINQDVDIHQIIDITSSSYGQPALSEIFENN